MKRDFKILADICPEIYEYWDWEKNSKSPDEVAAYDKNNVNLYCKIHNKYYQRKPTTISTKSCKCYCKVCARERTRVSRIERGNSELLMDYIPNIKEYWKDNVNECRLSFVTRYSKQKITLYCKIHDFYFDKKPASLEPNEELCPICAKKLYPVYILYPEVEKEYSDKNLFPFTQITTESDMKAIWKCSVPGCECEWVSSVAKHINGSSRCPNEKNHSKILKIKYKHT